MSTIRILRAGLCTTVQDRGRRSLRHLGIPVGGAMDLLSYELANRLVGNPENEAALEMTLTGDEIAFENDTLIAITGADMQPIAHDSNDEQHVVAQHCPVIVKAGVSVRFQNAQRGCRCYVALAGGVDVPRILDSRSTFLRAAFGGYCGRMLKAGDELTLGAPGECSHGIAQRLKQQAPQTKSVVQPRWQVRPEDLPGDDVTSLRVIPGAHAVYLESSEHGKLQDISFKVSNQSDRMGFRLSDHHLTMSKQLDLQSEGVHPGTIQLPPDGHPILLMADCAPTGGYPRIGHVISADIGLASQLRPGQSLRFVAISIDDAQTLYRHQWAGLRKSIMGMNLLANWA